MSNVKNDQLLWCRRLNMKAWWVYKSKMAIIKRFFYVQLVALPNLPGELLEPRCWSVTHHHGLKDGKVLALIPMEPLCGLTGSGARSWTLPFPARILQSFVSCELCINPKLGAGIPIRHPRALLPPERMSHQEHRVPPWRKADRTAQDLCRGSWRTVRLQSPRDLRHGGHRALCDEPKADQKIACFSLFPHSCNPDEQINCRVT